MEKLLNALSEKISERVGFVQNNNDTIHSEK